MQSSSALPSMPALARKALPKQRATQRRTSLWNLFPREAATASTPAATTGPSAKAGRGKRRARFSSLVSVIWSEIKSHTKSSSNSSTGSMAVTTSPSATPPASPKEYQLQNLRSRRQRESTSGESVYYDSHEQPCQEMASSPVGSMDPRSLPTLPPLPSRRAANRSIRPAGASSAFAPVAVPSHKPSASKMAEEALLQPGLTLDPVAIKLIRQRINEKAERRARRLLQRGKFDVGLKYRPINIHGHALPRLPRKAYPLRPISVDMALCLAEVEANRMIQKEDMWHIRTTLAPYRVWMDDPDGWPSIFDLPPKPINIRLPRWIDAHRDCNKGRSLDYVSWDPSHQDTTVSYPPPRPESLHSSSSVPWHPAVEEATSPSDLGKGNDSTTPVTAPVTKHNLMLQDLEHQYHDIRDQTKEYLHDHPPRETVPRFFRGLAHTSRRAVEGACDGAKRFVTQPTRGRQYGKWFQKKWNKFGQGIFVAAVNATVVTTTNMLVGGGCGICCCFTGT